MSWDNIILRRSLLYMPASRPEMFVKAVASGADVVCVDLEDATSDLDKDKFRLKAFDLACSNDNPGVECIVRINGLRTKEGMLDVIAISERTSVPDGILIPKVKTAEEIRIIRDLLGPIHPTIGIHIQIETNDGLEHVREIAKASHKIKSIIFGGFDMSAGLRVEPGWNSLLYARQRLVHAAASANIDILDMPNFDLNDPGKLEEDTNKSMEIGFTGKCAIHPYQIETINAAFTPSEQEEAEARDLISKFKAQDKAFTIIDGTVLEKPVLERLYRTIAIAERIKG